MANIIIGDYRYDTDGSVMTVDKTKTSYGAILSSFEYNDEIYQVTNMSGCFKNCENLIQAPTIPSNITNMEYCFQGCYNLHGNIQVSNDPENYYQVFTEIRDQNIYIVNIANSEKREEVAEKWRLIANTYHNVHYEADDHNAPTIILSAKRTKSNGESSTTGNYITVVKRYNYNLDNLPVNWDITLTELMELDGELVDVAPSEPGETVTFTIPASVDDSSHTVTYTVSDGYKTITQTIEISKVIALLDFFGNPPDKMYPKDKPGMGMAIGKISKRNGLDIEFPTLIGKGLEFSNTKNYSLTADTIVDENKTYYKREPVMEEIDLREYWEDSITRGGITWDAEDIGAIYVNGTAAAIGRDSCTFRIVSNGGMVHPIVYLQLGTYYIQGCPDNGSPSTYYLHTNYGDDYGEGRYFSQTNESIGLSCFCYIMNGYTAHDLVFFPSLYRVYENIYTYTEVFPKSTDNPYKQGWFECTQYVPLEYPHLIVGRYNKLEDNILFAIGGGTGEEEILRRNLLTVKEDDTQINQFEAKEIRNIQDTSNIPIALSEVPVFVESGFMHIEGSYTDTEDMIQDFTIELENKDSIGHYNLVQARYDENTNKILFTIEEDLVTESTREMIDDGITLYLTYLPDENTTLTYTITNNDTSEPSKIGSFIVQYTGDGFIEIDLGDWGTLVFDWTGGYLSIKSDDYFSFSIEANYIHSSPSDLIISEIKYLINKHITYMYIGSQDLASKSTGTNSLFIGSNNMVRGDNSVGIGSNLRIDENNQLVIGARNDTRTTNFNDVFVIGNGDEDIKDYSNALTISNNGSVNIWNRDYTVEEGGETNEGLSFVDRHRRQLGFIKAYYDDIGGYACLNLGAMKTIEDEIGVITKYNSIRMWIDDNDKSQIKVSDPTAWRNALGLKGLAIKNSVGISLTAPQGTGTNTSAFAKYPNNGYCQTIKVTVTSPGAGYIPIGVASISISGTGSGRLISRGFNLNGINSGSDATVNTYWQNSNPDSTYAVGSMTVTAQVIFIKNTAT